MPSRPTMADVARLAGVSTATVSRVLNQTAAVAPETAAAVHAAMATLSFRPHAGAQHLASGRTQTLGLLLPEIGGEYFPPMLRGIEGAASAAGFDLLVYATRPGLGSTPRPRRLAEHNTDGLLVFTTSLDEDELARLHRLHFPVVLLLQPPPPYMNIPFVTLENKSGARQVVDHLIEVHGRHRIAFLQGPEGNHDSYWREMGYREALLEHGLPFDPQLVAHGYFDDREAQPAVERWLREGLDFDAIFAGDDESAYGALQVLQRWGRNVPQEVALAGFDDIHLSQHLTPALTTVRAPIEEAGRRAMEMLVQLIQNGQAQQQVVLPTELVIRESCGCPTSAIAGKPGFLPHR